MKMGITPVIGIILLLLIVFALIASSYTFIFGAFESSASKTINYVKGSSYNNTVTIQNLGTETIQPEDLVVTVNGQQASVINPQSILPGKGVVVEFSSPVSGDRLNVRVFSPTNVVSFFAEISSVIVEETCSDGIRNQDEIGIDCGGVCITGNEMICDDGIDNDNDCFVDLSDSDCMFGVSTVLHFTMDKVTSNTIEDFSGNGNNGTLFGPDCTAPGISRRGCYFNGSTYIKTAPSDSLNLGGGNVSIAAWVKFNKLESSYDGIYNYGGVGGATNWYTLYLSNLNTTHMRISDKTLNGNLNFETGKWYFLAGTFDNNTNTITLYVNGKQDKNVVISFPLWGPATAQSASLGTSRTNSNEFINATIDEVAVWSSVLTPQEIEQLYNSKKRDIGLWGMEHFDMLPYFKDGVQVLQYSSYDRTGGNNNDGFSGRYSYLYMEGANYVIFDESGPGGIYNIWMTGTLLNDSGYILFYFDDEATPRINMTLGDFFNSAVGAPFTAPLTGRTSQSKYSYVPLLFEKRLKIVMTQQPYFYHFTYHKYADSAGIDTFTGTENYTAVINMWNNKGSHPTGDEGTQIASGNTGQINPGFTYTLLDYLGTNYNYISTVKIDTSPNDDATLENVWIKMYWDNETVPSVEAPIGEFFGSGTGEVDTGSLVVGMNTTGYYYSFFPMPFLSSAKLEIVNNGSSPVSLDYMIKAKNDSGMIPGFNAGYFHAKYNKEFSKTENNDYILLNTIGRGHYVGVIHTMRGLSTSADEPTQNYRRRYLEGDERFFVDGKLSPSMHGTGTEDYYMGAYYFSGEPYDFPLYGVHKEFNADGLGRYDYNPYRFQLSDFISFTNSIVLGVEHGAANEGSVGGGCAGSTWKNCNGNYSSVAFYYAIPEQKSVLTDELDVGNTANESAHSYSVGGGQLIPSQVFYYPGYDTNTPLSVSDDGRNTTNYNSTFTVSINNPNNGVTLRRRLDYSQLNQLANVYVDGEFVGEWYTAGMHDVFDSVGNTIRWLDSDFQIPPEFTENKNSIIITIENGNWNEFYYWVYTNSI